MFPTPPFHRSPLPPICLSPLRNLSIPLSSPLPLLPPPLFPCGCHSTTVPACPPHPSLSLSVSESVFSHVVGQGHVSWKMHVYVWVYRKTHLRRTMRELLDLFCFVSMGIQHVLVCLCVCRGSLFNLHKWRGHERPLLPFRKGACVVKICWFGIQKWLTMKCICKFVFLRDEYAASVCGSYCILCLLSIYSTLDMKQKFTGSYLEF